MNLQYSGNDDILPIEEVVFVDLTDRALIYYAIAQGEGTASAYYEYEVTFPFFFVMLCAFYFY